VPQKRQSCNASLACGHRLSWHPLDASGQEACVESNPAPHAVLTAYARSLIKFKARQLCRKPGFSRSDEDDLEQELTMRLLSKAHLYDPARASTNTFADRVIRSGIAMMLRDRLRQKRATGFTAQSLEAVPSDTNQDTGVLRDLLTIRDLQRRTGISADDLDRAELIAAVVHAVKSLPPDLQGVCRELIDGTISSAACNLGISRRQVRNAVARIRRHFEQAGLGNY
jgi:RNA polymerase sigma-70 factor, ECF subfamily